MNQTATAISLGLALLVSRIGAGRLRLRRLNSEPNSLASRLKWLRERLPKVGTSKDRQVVDLLAAVVAELHAGRNPETALTRSLADLAESGGGPADFPATRAALAFAGDVATALQQDALQPANAESQRALNGLAACWTVSADSGAGLAAGVARLAASERAEAEVRRNLRAELAGPRATAALLAALPLAGILLGTLLGARPLAWLLGTPLGWVTTAMAVVLVALGLAWVRRIISSALSVN
ncbi:MAG: hypothetical protein WCJ42_07290 [Actinomycetes bacterium]